MFNSKIPTGLIRHTVSIGNTRIEQTKSQKRTLSLMVQRSKLNAVNSISCNAILLMQFRGRFYKNQNSISAFYETFENQLCY